MNRQRPLNIFVFFFFTFIFCYTYILSSLSLLWLITNWTFCVHKWILLALNRENPMKPSNHRSFYYCILCVIHAAAKKKEQFYYNIYRFFSENIHNNICVYFITVFGRGGERTLIQLFCLSRVSGKNGMSAPLSSFLIEDLIDPNDEAISNHSNSFENKNTVFRTQSEWWHKINKLRAAIGHMEIMMQPIAYFSCEADNCCIQ